MLAVFLDQETTGLDALEHHVLEIAFKIVDLPSGDLKGEYESIIRLTEEQWEKRDRNSLLINGFTWEMVSQGKPLDEVKNDIITLFKKLNLKRGNSVFICQNPAFDRTFFSKIIDVYQHEKFQWPYHWLDFASMFWALMVQEAKQKHLPFPSDIKLSKDAIANYYHLPPEKRPHRAMNGVDHLILCYEKALGLKQK